MLIVGAGPVGLVAALRLRERGMRVRVVDEQAAVSKRTYPVLLHPQTLRVLDSLGISESLRWRGRYIKHLVVFADNLRRVVLDLPSAEEIAPGALTLPQDVLRQALMLRLATLGTQVEWQTRLVALEQDAAGVRLSLVRRGLTESRAPELKPETFDVGAESLVAEFVVGADGAHSAVRRALGIPMVPHGSPESYVFFDAADARAGDEAHLVLQAGYGSSVYPVHSGQSRFSFQVASATPTSPGLMELGRLLTERLPWYAARPEGFDWSGAADFQPAMAASFGNGRVWLAGDAAHSTSPLGGQSVNVGMQEADALATLIAESVTEQRGELGTKYAAARRREWNALLGFGPNAPGFPNAPAWILRSMPRLLSHLPVSGEDLEDVLQQLRARTRE